jgi:hypothetical protein
MYEWMKGFEYALHRTAKCPEMISESSTAIEDRRFKNGKLQIYQCETS